MKKKKIMLEKVLQRAVIVLRIHEITNQSNKYILSFPFSKKKKNLLTFPSYKQLSATFEITSSKTKFNYHHPKSNIKKKRLP